ncbi:MAG: hypothetical protein ACKOXB_10935 [Flavobacteriales bacterium]
MIVKFGVCPAVKSASALISIDNIATVFNSQTVCEGTTSTVDAGPGFKTNAWSEKGKSNSQTTIGDSAGTYTVTVIDSNQCSIVESIEVTKLCPDYIFE